MSEDTKEDRALDALIVAAMRGIDPDKIEAAIERAQTVKKPEELIQDLIHHGGAIVGSNECNEYEIAHARADGRFAVDEDGLGFVRRPSSWLCRVEEAAKQSDEDERFNN